MRLRHLIPALGAAALLGGLALAQEAVSEATRWFWPSARRRKRRAALRNSNGAPPPPPARRGVPRARPKL
jgi:hypothetical protein